MNFLVIDGTQNKIIFFSYYNKNSYNKSFDASKNNNDKFSLLLSEFFNENNINLSKLNNIFVNQGPGKFSGIRISISVAKGISLANNIRLVGFTSKDLDGENYEKILELDKKKLLIKDLIKPLYTS